MEGEGLKFTVAFLAGLASFASPCVLPLVPAYLGMLTGLGLEGLSERRYHVLLHALLFVLGFTLLFVITGAAATAFGRALGRQIVWVQRLGGIALVCLGLHMLRVLQLPFLYREQTLRGSHWGAGYLASFLTGAVFYAGWVPCIGPVLTAVYALAGSSQTLGKGMALLAVYSGGLGIPFLVVAFFAGAILPWLRRLGRAARWVEVGSGILVIAIGVAIFFDRLVDFSRLAGSVWPWPH